MVLQTNQRGGLHRVYLSQGYFGKWDNRVKTCAPIRRTCDWYYDQIRII